MASRSVVILDSRHDPLTLRVVARQGYPVDVDQLEPILESRVA